LRGYGYTRGNLPTVSAVCYDPKESTVRKSEAVPVHGCSLFVYYTHKLQWVKVGRWSWISTAKRWNSSSAVLMPRAGAWASGKRYRELTLPMPAGMLTPHKRVG